MEKCCLLFYACKNISYGKNIKIDKTICIAFNFIALRVFAIG